jgi:chromosome segregation ATPase
MPGQVSKVVEILHANTSRKLKKNSQLNPCRSLSMINLLKNWRWIVAILIIITIASYQLSIASLRAALNEARQRVNICKLESEQLTKQVGQQNQAINEWKHQADLLVVKINKAQQQAQTLRKQYQEAAQAVLNASVPKDCNKAITWAVQQGLLLKGDVTP